MQEFTEKTINEGVSPNPSDEIKISELSVAQSISVPEGHAPTAFQTFAAGAQFATPPGFEKPAPRKRKRGRPRKHPKNLSLNAGHPVASAEDVKTPLAGAPVEPHPEPTPVRFFEFTAPFVGMLSQIPAAKLRNKHWALTKDESIELAKALDPVINIYLPDLEKMDPKTAAILGFAMVAASIYHKKALEIEAMSKVAQQPPPPQTESAGAT